MKVCNVEVVYGAVFHDDARIISHRKRTERAVKKHRLRIAGTVAEHGRLQRRRIIPGSLHRIGDILLIPELPPFNGAAAAFCGNPGKPVGCGKIVRQIAVLPFRPCGRAAVKGADFHPAFPELPGAGDILAPDDLIRSGIHSRPAQAVADPADARPPGGFRREMKSGAGVAAVPQLGSGQPALGGVCGEDHIRIGSFLSFRHDSERDGAGVVTPLQPDGVEIPRQGVNGQNAPASLRPLAGTHRRVPGVENPVADRFDIIFTKGEAWRLRFQIDSGSVSDDDRVAGVDRFRTNGSEKRENSKQTQ